jgi:serine/threonine-protein kinase RsbW
MNSRNDTLEEHITIPNDIKYVREISSKILKKLESRNISESTLFDIRLCVEETVRNAMQHGNRHGKKSKVKISYNIGPDKFVIDVQDEGPGFDPGRLPDPTHDDNIMKGSGRGVYLVRHLMDKVEFNDKGNRVKLTKYL